MWHHCMHNFCSSTFQIKKFQHGGSKYSRRRGSKYSRKRGSKDFKKREWRVGKISCCSSWLTLSQEAADTTGTSHWWQVPESQDKEKQETCTWRRKTVGGGHTDTAQYWWGWFLKKKIKICTEHSWPARRPSRRTFWTRTCCSSWLTLSGSTQEFSKPADPKVCEDPEGFDPKQVSWGYLT